MQQETLTASQITRLLSDSYPQASGLSWLFVKLRPFIFPFGDLLAVMPNEKSYLDVGCGIGIMSVLLARVKRATRIVGVDTGEAAIATARRAVLPKSTHAAFHRIGVDDALPQEQVDNVVCLDVLHHVPAGQQREFIRRLARTNFRGSIYFKDVSPYPRWKALGSHLHDFVVSQELIHIRPEDDVRQWFEDEGLEVSIPRRMDTLWYTHYLLVATRKAS